MPYSYLVFGAGPRTCIGNTLATMEITLLAATVLQRFRLALNQTVGTGAGGVPAAEGRVAHDGGGAGSEPRRGARGGPHPCVTRLTQVVADQRAASAGPIRSTRLVQTMPSKRAGTAASSARSSMPLEKPLPS